MKGLVGDIVRIVGLTGIRLLQLNLLWIAGSLCGLVILGVGPSTAAVMSVLRRDALRGREGEWGPRDGVVREFAGAWRREFRSANSLAIVLGAAGAVVVVELLVLRASGDLAGTVSRVVLIAAGVWILVTGTLAWSLHAHFADGTAGILRRALALGAGRPLWGLVHLVAVGSVLAAYWFVPGLAVVFGITLPMAASFAAVWHSGVLPVPPGSREPLRRRDTASE